MCENELEKNYHSKGINFFTKEYYRVVSKIRNSNYSLSLKKSYFSNFREGKTDSLYQCLAIELVQENHCQLKCKWCYIGKCHNSKINNPISKDIALKIIDQAAQIDKNTKKKLFSEIVFIGGEPTLNRDLACMMRYTLEKGLSPILVTNGIKLAQIEYVRKVCLPGSTIVIHMPFMDEKSESEFDKLAGYDGYRKKLKKAIHNLLLVRDEYRSIGANIEVVGELVLNSATIGHAFDIYKFCRDNGIVPFLEHMRNSNGNDTDTSLCTSEHEINELMLGIFQYDLTNKFIPDCDDSSNLVKKIRYFLPPAINNPCTMAKTSIHIKYTEAGFGKVVSCCGQSISHGNILENSIWDILKNKNEAVFFTKQEDHIQGPCSVCELYSIAGCEGGCRGNANAIYGCVRASDPQCFFVRKDIKANSNIMCTYNCGTCIVQNHYGCSKTKQTQIS